MIIISCSIPQQIDAVTPTPLAHRSHTCMRALALGHDRLYTAPILSAEPARAERFSMSVSKTW